MNLLYLSRGLFTGQLQGSMLFGPGGCEDAHAERL